jgi:hypothetical protein
MSFYNQMAKYSVSLLAFQALEPGEGGKKDPAVARLALEACGRSGLWEEGEEIVRDMEWSREDREVRGWLLEAEARAGNRVEDVAGAVKAMGKEVDEPAANALLRAYQVAGNVEAAMETLRSMEDGTLGVSPSPASYELVMVTLAESGRPGWEMEAVSLFSRQNPPTAEGFRVALRGLYRAGRHAEALRLLATVGATCNVDPDDGLLKAGMKAVMGLGEKEALPLLQAALTEAGGA